MRSRDSGCVSNENSDGYVEPYLSVIQLFSDRNEASIWSTAPVANYAEDILLNGSVRKR